MRRIARIALWLLTCAVPVFIAACYGVARTYRAGKVLDKQTDAGIGDITLSCLNASGTANGGASLSDSTGAFYLDDDADCSGGLRAADNETARDGGTYTTVTVSLPSGLVVDPIVVEMER